MFADAPDQPREDFQDLASTPAFRDLVSELSGLGASADTPREAAQLFNRRTRAFGEPPPASSTREEDIDRLQGAARDSREEVPSSWEELDEPVDIDG